MKAFFVVTVFVLFVIAHIEATSNQKIIRNIQQTLNELKEDEEIRSSFRRTNKLKEIERLLTELNDCDEQGHYTGGREDVYRDNYSDRRGRRMIWIPILIIAASTVFLLLAGTLLFCFMRKRRVQYIPAATTDTSRM
ncbi:unnamed protein product [Didymodactylos carnosus]|uniref:Uncharacterized protein n=1 Tax=Didymodactylos carnosus TaxID=1234261 RepID=A0A8S2PFQ1_9BILA|nr:unnamed protein product [Didymodactylos carnosus]CAF4052645.1 unnamed protein product [Didymodactylos carnosus]